MYISCDIEMLILYFQVGTQDLGNYTCIAQNNQGRAEASIQLSGTECPKTLKDRL